MLHIDHKTFTNAAELIASRKAVRDRLMQRPKVINRAAEIIKAKEQREAHEAWLEFYANKTVDDGEKTEPSKTELKEQTQKLREMAEEIARLERRNTYLEFQQAEFKRQEELLKQAEKIAAQDPEFEAMVKAAQKNRRKVSAIIAEVLELYDWRYSLQDILGPKRQRQLVMVRQECMWEVYKQRPDLSLPQIGIKFDRDHTTILHAVRQHERRIFGFTQADATKRKPRPKATLQSGVTGIIWDKSLNKWQARIWKKNTRIGLGAFEKLEDAIAAKNAYLEAHNAK